MSSRQDDLLKLLELRGSQTISELAAQLYASESTIRRDVAKLEKLNLIGHSNSNVFLLNREQGLISFAYSLKTHVKEKRIIARLAAEQVQNKSTVFIASASTTYFMIPMLAKKQDIQVITDGLQIALKSAEYGIKTICLGGSVSFSMPFAGGLFAEDMLARLHADMFFFSVPHISYDGKLWHHSPTKLRIMQLMMKNATQSVLLCNSQKIDDTSETYLFCTTDELDGIISEQPLPSDLPLKKGASVIFP